MSGVAFGMDLTFLCKVSVWFIFVDYGLSFFTCAVGEEDFIKARVSLLIVEKLHKLIYCQVGFFLCTTEINKDACKYKQQLVGLKLW